MNLCAVFGFRPALGQLGALAMASVTGVNNSL